LNQESTSMRFLRRAVAICLLLAARAAYADGDVPVQFTADEIARIASHGPWPPPFTRDPSNRVSGDPFAIDLGRRLFFDVRFSPNHYVACVACHQTDRAFTDTLARGHALAPVDRNTQSLANLRLQRWYGWGGTGDSLWMQSLRPILDPRELGSSAKVVAEGMRTGDGMACRYQAAFKRPVPADDELVLVDVAKALAAFQETLTTGRTPFDDFRDALASGERAAQARYPEPAKRGLRLFIGRGNCAICHTGPNFSNGEFHDSGVPYFIRPGVADAGRHEGIRAVAGSPFNQLGRYNDDPSRGTAQATRHVRLEPRNWGEFRTPSLRNVAVTPPYMHNGSFPTLRDVVRHYSELDEDRLHADGERILKRLSLTPREIDDLVAFLETLTDADGERRRLPELMQLPCD
jgi:cytochrome c peroxidase